jgi:gamma-glutamyltranspeptidase
VKLASSLSHTSSLFSKFSNSHIFNFANILEIQSAGGIVSTEDIKAYVPIVHAPLQMPFMGHTYVGKSVW